MEQEKLSPTVIEIQSWLVEYLAQSLKTTPEQIDIMISWDLYGLDSSDAVGMIGALGEWLEMDLDLELLEDYGTIQSLAEYCGNLEEINL
jgi:acyl carrier protein